MNPAVATFVYGSWRPLDRGRSTFAQKLAFVKDNLCRKLPLGCAPMSLRIDTERAFRTPAEWMI